MLDRDHRHRRTGAPGGLRRVGFNKLRTCDVAAQEALGGIDVQLTRRADLIPNLVDTVKGYAAHEKGVFEEITRRAPACRPPRPATASRRRPQRTPTWPAPWST